MPRSLLLPICLLPLTEAPWAWSGDVSVQQKHSRAAGTWGGSSHSVSLSHPPRSGAEVLRVGPDGFVCPTVGVAAWGGGLQLDAARCTRSRCCEWDSCCWRRWAPPSHPSLLSLSQNPTRSEARSRIKRSPTSLPPSLFYNLFHSCSLLPSPWETQQNQCHGGDSVLLIFSV